MQTILKKLKFLTIKTNKIKVFCIANYSQKPKKYPKAIHCKTLFQSVYV